MALSTEDMVESLLGPPEDDDDSDADAVVDDQEEADYKLRRRNIQQRQEIEKYLASKSPEEVFREFDVDNSGSIDFEEFREMLDRLNFQMSEAKALKYFRSLDKDGSGVIDEPEFRAAMYAVDPVTGNSLGFAPNSLLTPQDAFQMFDEDGSGQIDEDEFADILEYMGMDVSDAKQEQMFKEYDKDGSGSIDYDEFRHIWAMVANVRQELANRGLKFSKFVPTFVLREKLKKILDEEEDKESEALVHAEAWKEWQDALTEKKKLFAEARVIADNALALALDAGGQVYMFGAGTHGQFRGASFAHAFEQFAHVQETWEGRVAQDPKMATYLEEKQANQIRSGMESKPETTAPEATLWDNPFGVCNVMANTANLWGRGIIHVSLGLNTAFALTWDGSILSWGGNSDFYKTSNMTDDDADALNLNQGLVTERSARMKGTLLMDEPELVNRGGVTSSEIAQAKEDHELDRLKRVFMYYNVYTPEPVKSFRKKHFHVGLLPKVSMDEMRLSLTLRHGKRFFRKERSAADIAKDAGGGSKKNEDQDPDDDWDDASSGNGNDGSAPPGGWKKVGNTMNKVQMAAKLAEDLEFEQYKQIDSAALAQMELDITMLEKNKQTRKANKIRQAFSEIWQELEVEQEAWREQLLAEEEAEYDEVAQEKENRYLARVKHEEEEKQNQIVQYTPRGRSLDIGIGGITTRGRRPRTPRGYNSVITVEAGAHHVVALHSNGQVYTWGTGTFGRLGLSMGDGKKIRESADRPTLVETLSGRRVVSVSAGYTHTCAVLAGGSVVTWGSAVSGKLGLGEYTDEHECFCPTPTPVTIPAGRRVKMISAGHSHTGCVTMRGEVYMWGCGDSGRLGLGRPLQTMYKPVLVKSLLHEKIAAISCGSSHTAVVTGVNFESESGVESVSGGTLFVCGAAAILKVMTPGFKRVKSLMDQHIVNVSCGAMCIAVVNDKGEVFSWGRNDGGAAFQPIPQAFIETPQLCRALYVSPLNLALGKPSSQSSVYNRRGPDIANNGSCDGQGMQNCIHTQLDIQPWWEVDLGGECLIESITVWNRQDSPPDRSRPKDTFTKRLVPFWIITSAVPFPQKVNDRRGLSKSLRRANDKRRFTRNRRRTMWSLPPSSSARYVRIQLEGRNYLHVAEVEVVGYVGNRVGVGKVHRVECGTGASVALLKPTLDQEALDSAYKAAVRADAGAKEVLKHYNIYRKSYERFDDCKFVKNCVFCRGGKKCAVCLLSSQAKWNLSDIDMDKIRSGGPLGKRMYLDDIGELLINQPQPEVRFEKRERKQIKSKACLIQ